MGSDSIMKLVMDLSYENIWRCWQLFRKGKKKSRELTEFIYHQEKYLWWLFKDLNNCTYKHGGYKKFTVCDNKKREIAVASITDRIVHRMVYEYLVPVFDHEFCYDVWSCRKGKGLHGALERTQEFMLRYADCYVWRADVKKFFDSVDQKILFEIMERKVRDPGVRNLIQQIIESYNSGITGKGIPIGNLTSQIFANIYLNELDRFVLHQVKPLAYLRYGDDFVVFVREKMVLEKIRETVVDFLGKKLMLKIHANGDNIIKSKSGLNFLGCKINVWGRSLNGRNRRRVNIKLNPGNYAGYYGIIMKNEPMAHRKVWHWLYELI